VIPVHPKHRWIMALALLVLASGRNRALASTAPPSTSGEVSVTLVEIPVEVTQGDRPVTGLTADDFEVTEGRRSLPIVSFETVDLDKPAAPGVKDAQKLPSAARRHLLFLFDFAFSDPQHLAQGIASAREVVAGGLDPSDLVGVGVYLPKGELQLVLNFTHDRTAATRTLAALEQILTGKLPKDLPPEHADPLRLTGLGARGLLTQVWKVDDRNLAIESIESITLDRSRWGSLLQHNVLAHSASATRPYIQARMESDVEGLVAGMEGLAKVLRPVTGRKYLALFSDGFNMANLAYSLPTPSAKTVGIGGSGLLDKMGQAMDELRRSGWVVHGVSLRGTQASLSADSLFFLSNQTGGKLVEGTNDLSGGLERAMKSSTQSYLIGVQAEDVPFDGSWHPLKVRLRKEQPRGVRVQHRGGFFAPLPFQRQDDVRRLAEASHLVAGDDERDDLGINVVAVPLGTSVGTGAGSVAVVVEVPGQRLLSPGAPRVGLEVYGYALDKSGTSNDFFAESVDLDPVKVGERLALGGVRVLGKLSLPPGEHRLRILARDRGDGRTSLLTVPLTVATAAPEDREDRIDALFLPPAGDPWLLVRPAAAAFDLHGRSVLPAGQASLSATGEAQILVVGHGLADQERGLRSRILDLAGKPMTGGKVELLGVTPGEGGEPDLVVGRLSAGSLPPGSYLLELRLGTKTRVQAITARPFQVSAGTVRPPARG
jgi:VWFA-related protein